jgi:hypothetical protein
MQFAGKSIAIIITITFILFGLSGAANAEQAVGFNNFVQTNNYIEGQFTDVTSDDWFSTSVATVYDLGLMKGSRSNYFNASGSITIAETIAVASRIHSIYYTGNEGFEQSNPWYQTYVNYALENGIIGNEYADYSRVATRVEFATILANALPDEAYEAINIIDDNMIPDVPISMVDSTYVYKLYRAGILTGNDTIGTFDPKSNIKRNAVATIVARIVFPDSRIPITMANVSMPDSGYIFYKNNMERLCPLTVITQGEDSYYIKLIDTYTQNDVIVFFVGSNVSVDLNVPVGDYEIKYASGVKWYGEQLLFGPNTNYTKIEDVFSFTASDYFTYGWTIELYKQIGGNLESYDINAGDF